jgi:23S rRNA (uracil1939-C5)-methyltransferase
MELAASEEDRKWGAVETAPETEEEFSALGKPETVAMGESRLHRRAGPFTYAVSPAAFFQGNSLMLDALVACVVDAIESPGMTEALDLFAGVGLFTLPLARHYGKVIAVESSAEACRLFEHNVEAAGVRNATVVRSEAARWMKAIHSVSSPAYDLILLDPPRSGAGQSVMQLIREWAPETVIYVSCDPQTLCRDVAFLPARDYRIDFVRGLDLFPQTYHFETVMRLRRR